MMGMKWLPLLAVLLLILTSCWGAYQHGRTTMELEWQARWADRDSADNQAKAQAEAAERVKEQIRQQSINKVIQDGQSIIDRALADAAAARADRSVRDEADRTASHAAGSAGSHSCTAAASAAATRAVLVLADVFKRADERAGDLAAAADQSRGRGMTCEQAYTALNPPE